MEWALSDSTEVVSLWNDMQNEEDEEVFWGRSIERAV